MIKLRYRSEIDTLRVVAVLIILKFIKFIPIKLFAIKNLHHCVQHIINIIFSFMMVITHRLKGRNDK